ncbi:hypothetical protein TspCOW1_17770 [Thiohalobacter sp. COW1]|uniref:hypothetical protein n=1 Tax=Thiohalobacter sp. COW1 TaxID=2795687 RepID=UPI0019169B86|nr:hypothetical protein [Thiohalobacter sp. COW1]BCO31674.1 hypothetical protein TspCOW1_17770 [Thiohalobacter sp. COW1]
MHAFTNFIKLTLGLAAIMAFLSGCGGIHSFPHQARAGDTVALAVGWMETFERNEVTVHITASDGTVTTLAPGDPAVRAVVNLYPDPLSYNMVGVRTGLRDYRGGSDYGSVIEGMHTGNDPDWYETVIFLDLPTNLPTGISEIDMQSAEGENYSISVDIIPGQGEPDTFEAESLGGLSQMQLRSLERAPHYIVKFDGADQYPAAIHIQLTHDPDETAGGEGIAYVVNPRTERKNLSWTDDGTNMQVMITPSGDGTWEDSRLSAYGWKRYKFYVTGNITNLQAQNVNAYDSVGNPISGITANIIERSYTTSPD